MPEHGEIDGAAEAGLEDIRRDAAIKRSDFSIVVEVPAGDGYVLEEVGSEGDILGRNHQDHFDVLERLECGCRDGAGNEAVLTLV